MATLSSPTLQNLISDIRIQLNQRDPNNTTWRDDEIGLYLNDGIKRYFVELVQADEGYFTTQVDLNIVANVETIALPSDCFQVKNLWKKVTNGFISLNYKNSHTMNYSTIGGSSSESYFPDYSFQGNNIVLRDTPNFSETAGIRMEYLQFPNTIVYGGDTLTDQISPIFKELLEIYAIYKCKLKESMVSGGNMHLIPAQQLMVLEAQFKSIIEKRSKNPTYVQAFLPESYY